MDRQCSSCGGFCKKSGCERENTKPKREWVGLTEDEFEKILETHNQATTFAVYLNIEAKLKEKNT